MCLLCHLWLIQGVRLSVHAGLPGVTWHVGHGDEEQGDSTQDEQGEGGASAGKGPRIVVFDPDGLITVNHPLDRLAHYLNRNDDAKACVPKQKEWVAGKSRFTHINANSVHIYTASSSLLF